MDVIQIDRERCTVCGMCVQVCVRRILNEVEGEIRVTDPSLCILCGHCKAVCPEDAPVLPTLDESEFQPIPPRGQLPSAESLMWLFRARRTTRIYKGEPVSREDLNRVLEAGRFAPTGGNRQPLQYVVIQDPKKLNEIRRMTIEALLGLADQIERTVLEHQQRGQPLPSQVAARRVYVQIWRDLDELERQGVDRLFFHAPALVVCHADPSEAPTPEVDAGLAAMQMVLMAEALGLGTCFSGFLVFALQASKDLKEALGIPTRNLCPFALMVGHPDVQFLRAVARNPLRVKWL